MSKIQGFTIEKVEKTIEGMKVDQVTTFHNEKTGKVEAEYFYWQGQCNYLLSWGFNAESLGEDRRKKAHKNKKKKGIKPFFTLEKGWYGYESK